MLLSTLLSAILVIATIYLVIRWQIVLKNDPSYKSAPNYSRASFGMRCSTASEVSAIDVANSYLDYTPQPCDVGLFCATSFNDTTGICLKQIGTPCSSLNECVSAANSCLGVCRSNLQVPLGGVCNGDSECSNNAICDTATSPARCRLPENESGCVDDVDCASDNVCIQGTCFSKLDPGRPCSDSGQCAVGQYCSAGFCQATIYNTGETGAACWLWRDPSSSNPNIIHATSTPRSVPRCNFPQSCAETPSNFSLPYDYGTCHETAKWGATCSATLACSTPQVCAINGSRINCDFPRLVDTSNRTKYTPLACNEDHTTGLCLSGTICSSLDATATCLGVASSGLPILSNLDCNASSVSNRSYFGVRRDYLASTQPQIDYAWTRTAAVFNDTNSSSLVANASPDYNQVTLGCIEISANVFQTSLHLRGRSTMYVWNPNTPNSRTEVTLPASLLQNGTVHRAGLTTTGKYYMLVIYPRYTHFYIDTTSNFSNSSYPGVNPIYKAAGNINLPPYIYWLAIDDRYTNYSAPRVVIVAGSTSPTSTQLIYPGTIFYSTTSQLNSFTPVTGISNPVWAEPLTCSSLNTSQLPSSFVYYRQGTSNLGASSNGSLLPLNAPVDARVGASLTSIAVTMSMNIAFSDITVYYVINYLNTTGVVNGTYLQFTRNNLDVTLPAVVNSNTLLVTSKPATGLDTANYTPALFVLSRTCDNL